MRAESHQTPATEMHERNLDPVFFQQPRLHGIDADLERSAGRIGRRQRWPATIGLETIGQRQRRHEAER